MRPDDLDRALEEALSVEPPAGYAARVRLRIAAEQAASEGGHRWWTLRAAAAGLVLLVTGGLILERDDPSLPAVATSRAAAETRLSEVLDEPDALRPSEFVIDSVLRSTRATGTTAGRNRPRGAAAGAAGSVRLSDDLPVVIVSPDDAAGLQLFVTSARVGSSVPVNVGELPPQIGRIDLSPIELDPLPDLPLLALGELE